jgi:glycyl-tRNA synthetase beta chain
VLAIAERADTLAGGFAVGLKPTGNKDPFALRRAALGLARTDIEAALDLDLDALLAQASAQVGFAGEVSPLLLREFVIERLRGYYADAGVRGALFDAALGARSDTPLSLTDLDRRVRATATFAALPEAEALAAANKRIRNILRKADEASSAETAPAQVDPALLEAGAERALFDALIAAERDTDAALAARDHVQVLQRLAQLRAPVDAYFDAVMVMAEDPALRRNRLALLARLAGRFLAVADISGLSGS